VIDLHCHLLPGIDDGAADIDVALDMARMAVADGIDTIACTPHIYPGLYENSRIGIEAATTTLRQALVEAGIALNLVVGADTHLVPGLLARLRSGDVPTLAGSDYFLLEPAHHVAPPQFAEAVFEFVAAGYTPVVTHPERLTWIDEHYGVFARLVKAGAWMQITAGSLSGRFGPEARYWGERMLDEGLVHILATDAHGTGSRAPLLAEGRDAAEKWVGKEEARRLIEERPRCILHSLAPTHAPAPIRTVRRGLRARLTGWLGRG
jgi:protein-tyrosine phosphatase